MSFDGGLHRSGQWVIDFRSYASRRIATARLLSRALMEAYVYADEHSQLIGCLTFPPEYAWIEASTPQTFATIERFSIPPHALKIIAAVRYAVRATNAFGIHRMTQLGSPNQVSADTPGEGPTTGFRTTIDSWIGRSARVEMGINDAAVDRTDMTITMAAHGVNSAGLLNFGYRPESITFYWAA